MRYTIHAKHRDEDRNQKIRISTHHSDERPEVFRRMLVSEYGRRNHQILWIEVEDKTLEQLFKQWFDEEDAIGQ